MSLLLRLQSRSTGSLAVRRDVPEFGEKFLTNLIMQQDEQSEESRVSAGYIHVSSLLNFCARKWRIAVAESMQLINLPRSSDRVVWAIGKACEAHVRKQVIGSIGIGNVYGRWLCSCGVTEHFGPGRGLVCPTCRTEVKRFNEIPVFDHDLKVIGSPDLILIQGAFRVVEIKSINKKEFDALTAPKPDHVFQVNMYRRMLAAEGHDVHEKSIVFYVSKDYGWAMPYKEFHVDKDDQLLVIDNALANVRILRASESAARLPNRVSACSSVNSVFAKSCPCHVSCFSR